MQQSSPAVENVHVLDLSKVDFSSTVFPLIARQPTKEDEAGCLALSPDDWAVLYRLLTTPVPLPDGSKVRAVDESNGLQLLARISQGALEWYRRTGTVPRPESAPPAWTVEAT